ncbi:MAG: 50S ribosomal protein L17 [Thermodesulfobacteriota bacterium]|nr:50S ribosomal protein L17 [Thermodesulfobacteriota bacterium]
MRHQKAGKKLNRTGSHRNAMFRNMVTSLFTHGRIRTTHAKAKELMRWADHMITLAKRGDLHARRQALSVMRDKRVVHKLFEEAQDRFGQRAGGYTRVVKIGRRQGDAAPISLIEFVSAQEEQKRKKKKPKAPKKKEVAAAKKEAPVESPEDETETETAEKAAEPAGEIQEETAAEPKEEEQTEETPPPLKEEDPKTEEPKKEEP